MSKSKAIKCVVVGDNGVGKTSLITTFATNRFPDNQYVSGMFDPIPSVKTMFGNKTIDLALWDTAGQDEYDRLRPLAYPQTDVFLICFSVISPASYANVRTKWHPELTHHCPNVPTLLVGTMTDLRSADDNDDGRTWQQLPMSAEQGERLAEEIGAFMYLECAARTQEGLQNLFHEAIRVALDPTCNNGKTGNKATKKTCSLF
jgi:Ras-related C3 botulinum toxin substrate 1